jgi:SH3 domain-containing YSC84-like protein 1
MLAERLFGSLGCLGSRRVLPLALGLVLIAGAGAQADERADAEAVVQRATQAVETFRSGHDRETIDALMAHADGVIVYPSILKAAFLVGGETGTGVLLGRDADGRWSGPAFFTFAAASYGLQAGAEESKVLMIVMNQATVERAVRGGLELGSNATVAVGDAELKAKLLSTDQLQDIYYFAESEGLFAGFNLKGATALARDSLNAAYYGTPVSAEDIVLHRKVSGDGAAALHAALGE